MPILQGICQVAIPVPSQNARRVGADQIFGSEAAFLASVTPRLVLASGDMGAAPVTVPRGRYYGLVAKCSGNATAPGFQTMPGGPQQVVRVLWSGYLSEYNPTSYVNELITGNDWLVFAIWVGSNGPSGGQAAGAFDLIVDIRSQVPSGGGLEPYLFLERPFTGPGERYTLPVTNPAAGADWSKQLPAFVRWTVWSTRFQFATSAAVANRTVHQVSRDPGGNENENLPSPSVQAASLTWKYNFDVGAVFQTQQDSVVVGPLSMKSRRSASQGATGDTLASFTGSIQAADQYSGIFLDVEEWAGPDF